MVFYTRLRERAAWSPERDSWLCARAAAFTDRTRQSEVSYPYPQLRPSPAHQLARVRLGICANSNPAGRLRSSASLRNRRESPSKGFEGCGNSPETHWRVASAAWMRWPWSSVIRLESTLPKCECWAPEWMYCQLGLEECGADRLQLGLVDRRIISEEFGATAPLGREGMLAGELAKPRQCRLR